jgi:hypothetical protein
LLDFILGIRISVWPTFAYFLPKGIGHYVLQCKKTHLKFGNNMLEMVSCLQNDVYIFIAKKSYHIYPYKGG